MPGITATSDAGAGADAYENGWAYEGDAGDDGIGLFTVPENAPDTLYYQSETLAGMGAQLNIIDVPSPSVTIAGRLTNSGQVELPGSILTLQNGADLTGGSLNMGEGKLVMEGSLTKTGGTVTTNEATLKINDNISITSNDELIFQDLDLENSTLTLGSATSELTVSNTVTLGNATDGINAGGADLTLSGGLTLTDGDVEANGGTISLGNTSTIATDGMLDVSNSTLKLNAGLSVTGNLKTDNTYDLILFSESFQYVPIKKSLEKCYQLLNPNGYILICDFFQKDPSHFTELRGGHSFPKFQDAIQSSQFKEITNIDVTEQTAPTIQILDDFLTQFGGPLKSMTNFYLENQYPKFSKLLKWKYRKRIKKLNRIYFSGQLTVQEYMEQKTYRFMLYQKQ